MIDKTVQLGDIAVYENEKIKCVDLDADTYVGTDNLLQDKRGVQKAVYVPKNGTVNKYSADNILISNIRPYLKKIWFADKTGGSSPDVLNLKVVDDAFEPGFVYYSLFRDDFFKHMMRGSKGTKMPRGDKDHVMEFVIPDIAKRDQVRISALLSLLDKKIQNNTKICQELESVARQIYEYWFIQFDYPDNEGRPYKSSGGALVYSPELKRKIPEGWLSSNILYVSDLLGGGTPKKDNDSYWSGDIPFFTPSDAENEVYCTQTEDNITESGLKNSSTRLFEENTALITARGSVGKLQLCAKPMAMNQSCYALSPKSDYSYTYVYFLAKQLIHHLEVQSSGSVFNSIVTSDIEHSIMAIPSKTDLVSAYAHLVEPMFNVIKSLALENEELRKTRDWLLPMLMNGQVKVKDAA